MEENIRLETNLPNPGWTYDADWIAKPADIRFPVTVFELKTSIVKRGFDDFDGSEFRLKQFQVLVLANLGGHVLTDNRRVINLGLIPGAVLPPLAVTFMYALPGRGLETRDIGPRDFSGIVAALGALGVP